MAYKQAAIETEPPAMNEIMFAILLCTNTGQADVCSLDGGTWRPALWNVDRCLAQADKYNRKFSVEGNGTTALCVDPHNFAKFLDGKALM